MRIINYLLLLAMVVSLVGCSSYYTTEPANSFLRVGYDWAQVDQVGIVSVFGAVQSSVIRKQIEDGFTAQFLQKGYAPVVSEFMTRELVKIKFDAGGMSPEVFAIEAGRALAYSTVMLINVTNFSDEISITAKLLDVNSNTVIWIGQNSILRKTESQGGGFFKSKESAYEQEFENALKQYNAQSYGGGVNQVLSSQEERQMYELIASICESLPMKPMAWEPAPYQQQIPSYTQPARITVQEPVVQPVVPQPPVVQQPIQPKTQIQEPIFQPEPQPRRTQTKRKFRLRDLID